jgi:hypothetical protein
MSGVGSELSRISRLSHDSVFDAWLIQLRAVLVLRDLHQFIDNAPARNQSDQIEGDKRALAIVTLGVDERLQPTAATASNTKTALQSLRAATQGSLLDRNRGVEDNVVKLRQGAKESLASYCQRAEALEQQLLAMRQTGMQPMLIDRFLQGLRSAPLKAALASTADLIREESVIVAVSTVRSHARMIGPEALLPETSAVGNDEEDPGHTNDKLGPAAFTSTAISRVQQVPSRYRGHARNGGQVRGRMNRFPSNDGGPQVAADQCTYCLQHGHWKAGCPQWRAHCRERARNNPAAHAVSRASNNPPECPQSALTEHAI